MSKRTISASVELNLGTLLRSSVMKASGLIPLPNPSSAICLDNTPSEFLSSAIFERVGQKKSDTHPKE